MFFIITLKKTKTAHAWDSHTQGTTLSILCENQGERKP
jgi:hypothetical protein